MVPTQIGPKTQGEWSGLSAAAWKARENAYTLGLTKVGAAALSISGTIHSGCNVEHRFRSHDIHAEVNALSSLVAAGGKSVVMILIVADRERFTPCGACLDWIFQLGGDECVVGFQRLPEGPITSYTASELMPYYPIGHSNGSPDTGRFPPAP